MNANAIAKNGNNNQINMVSQIFWVKALSYASTVPTKLLEYQFRNNYNPPLILHENAAPKRLRAAIIRKYGKNKFIRNDGRMLAEFVLR